MSLALPPVPVLSNQETTEITYSLPKSYNGKTVFDLFPEFKEDSVLRFSKLFGLGRATSLPKIWKGSRKRKKPKGINIGQAPTGRSLNTSLPSIKETNFCTKLHQQTTDLDDDVFKTLDEAFLPLVTNKQNTKETGENFTEGAKVSSVVERPQAETAVGESPLELLAYEVDDDVDFMKPFKILEDLSENKSPSAVESSKDKFIKAEQTTWRYGPASFWYESLEPSKYMIKPLEINKHINEKKEKTNKPDDDDESSVDSDEEKMDQGDKKHSPNSDKKAETNISSECETINLITAIKSLNAQVKEDKYLLVSTMKWEDNILIDSGHRDNNDSQCDQLINERIKYAGWIPSGEHRTLYSYQSKVLGKKVDFLETYKEQAAPSTSGSNKQNSQQQQTAVSVTWNSIFPNENYELFIGDWEKKIILDHKKIDPSLFNPPEFYIDPNDDNFLIGMLDDLVNNVSDEQIAGATSASRNKETDIIETKREKSGKVCENRSKVSKALLNRAKDDQNNNEIESDSNLKLSEPKNFWNVSNDEYYNPKVVVDTTAATVSKNVSTNLVLQHTLVAHILHHTFFPTHINSFKLRNFHRQPLRRILTGLLLNESQLFPVSSLLKPANYLNSESTSIIQNFNDLTATDNCEIILAEYSEQFPPLMMQAGMATKIRNYYKRKFAKDDGPQNLEYGEQVYVNNSPFLGALKPGETLQALENFMFRAPIYKHKIPEQDFLVVRNRQTGYTVRSDIKTLFVVGQECPLIEVPGPNSKRANSFLKDFLQVFMFRLFHKSREFPKRVKIEDIKKAFPQLPESSIRKRLKLYADLRRTEKSDANWWVLKEEIRLPTEEEIRGTLTPEQCCAYYSMCAAEQRLKDAGYGEKNLFASDDDDVDNIKIDDEVKNAPWHTTRAYIDAVKGKCLLQINGVADPTGRGEGFSYVRQPFKNNKQDDEQDKNEKTSIAQDLVVASPSQPTPAAPKRTVTGTDADLRRLHLSQAKVLLAEYGVPEHEIKKLKRWEIIDVVRTMSTQKAKEGNGSAVSKFARGNRYSQSDAHEKFRDECQNLFDMQNRNLASEEFLSTDDDENLDEDSDVDEMGKNLESMLQSKMTEETNKASTSANTEANKINSKPIDKSTELKNLIMSKSTTDAPVDVKSTPPNMHRILKITRTYRDEESGQEMTKVEVVKKPMIIDAYVKIRSTKDDEFIRSAFALDETEKEKLRKERRRLQEQLRRVKRNEAKRAHDNSPLDGVMPKVRKYNKSGLPRKTKKSAKMMAAGGNESLLNSGEIGKTKSMVGFSSADDEKSMGYGVLHGGDTADQSQSNLLDTTASSLNNTLSGQVPGVVKKRKYQKRKKLDQDQTQTSAETGLTGLSKLEGTKLIIQKKAIKLAMNSSENNNDSLAYDPDNPDRFLNTSVTTGKPKKPRISKKFLKSQLSSQLIVDPNHDPTGEPGENLKLKISLNSNNSAIKKPKKLILKIPKENLGASFNSSQSQLEPGEAINFNDSQTGSSIIDQSPSKSNKSALTTPNQPKRTYNKTNSLLKKQQKLMMQQHLGVQQQLEQQLKLQISQAAQLGAGNTNSDQFAAAVAAASQFAGLFEMQQMLALQQQMAAINTPGTSVSLNRSKSGSVSSQQAISEAKQRKLSTQSSQQMDYLIKPHLKKTDRRHADPLVSYASILENILNELRDTPDAQNFLLPVNSKKVPDYYKIVKKPIDLQTIRTRINDKVYKNRASFLDDLQLLIENSVLYNGSNSPITTSAETLYATCQQKLEEKKDKLMRLEKAINPLLDENSLIALNYLFNQIYDNHIMNVENAFAFLKPVNKAKYKDYYEVVKIPIDLETIKNKINYKKYKSREDFISDFDLLYNNCLTYNGPDNSYTNTAQKLLSVCAHMCNIEYGNQLQQLEEMATQNEDDNSLGSYVPNRIQSSASIDTVTDSESNFTINQNDADIFEGRSSNNMPIPMLSLTKKLNKKMPMNNLKGSKMPVQQHTPESMSGKAGESSGSMLKKNNQLFFPTMSHKDSPKSGSDADVFVDVESIDDRSYANLIGQQRGRISRENRIANENDDVIDEYQSNIEMGEYESDVNVYNEDF